jgi:hypothetical protein
MNSRFKFPRRVRIHGGECGAVARALHHEVKSSSLYQADTGKALGSTFIERKQMSTKTTLKRIALVAVSALGVSFLAVTPSSAAPTAAFTSMYDTTNGNAIVGSQAVVTFTVDTSTTNTFTWSGVGTVLQAEDDGTNADFAAYSGTEASEIISRPSSGTLVAVVGSGGAGTVAFTLTSTVAGTQTITVTPVASGVPGSAVSKTVTWVSVADTAISASNTIIALVAGTSYCADSTVYADDATLAAAGARSTLSYRDTAGNRAPTLCIIARDGFGNVIPKANLDTVLVSTSVASFAASGTVTRFLDLSGAASSTGEVEYPIYGDNIAQGAGTVSVTIIENSVSVTKTLTLTQWGKIAKAEWLQSNYSLAADSDGADYTDAANKNGTAVVGYIKCTDSAGTTVARCDYDGDGNVSADSGDTGAVYLVVDNDLTPGSPAFSAAAPASVSELLSNSFSINQGLTAVLGSSTWGLQVLVDNDLADVTAIQKSTITVYIKDASATGTPATITTGAQTFYTPDAADKVTLTVDPTSVAVGGIATVQVSVVDENGYPVEDGTSVTMNATNGSIISGGSSSTTNGKFSTAKNFIAGDQATSSVVVAAVGSKSASQKVTITGSSATGSIDAATAAADAAAEAIDAANAATDAANLAAEAADAATVAAEEARDAADAATAAVEELATQVATLMAALKAQITTLANTVAKIAKKVKA